MCLRNLYARHLVLYSVRLASQVRAVLEPPYSTRLERPLVTHESAKDPTGPPEVVARSAAKKELDKMTFGTTYF